RLALLSLKTGKVVCRIEAQKDFELNAADIAADGRTFATFESTFAGRKMYVRLHARETGKTIHVHALTPSERAGASDPCATTQLRYHPDGKTFVVAESWTRSL